MPKIVDHPKRRDELVESVWSIAATRGLHAASLREVAREAGVSMGMVQHYFGTREALVRHACRRLTDLAAEGLAGLLGEADPLGAGPAAVGGTTSSADPRTSAVGASSDPPSADHGHSPRQVLRLLAVQTLPATAEERLGAGVWLAFVTEAVLHPELAAMVRATWDGAHSVVVAELARAQQLGQLAADRDPADSATGFLTLIEGLVPRLVLEQLSSPAAMAVVDSHLDGLVGGAPATTRRGRR